jgi:hypothetical protein
MRLHRLPLPAFLAHLTPTGGRQSHCSPRDLEGVVRLVVRMCRLRLCRLPLFPSVCLRQALALYYTLTRLGYAVIIHFGVRKMGEVLYGHSWITVRGHPVAEPAPEEIFQLVYTYPPATGGAVHAAGPWQGL